MGFYSDKLAFVTGASEGIGKEVALALVREGARVVIMSRSVEKLARAEAEILALHGVARPSVVTQALDVTDAASTQRILAELVQRHGTPDFVINCAGFARPGYLDSLELDDMQRMMDLNYFGIVHVTKALVPHLMKARKGHIVNTSSMAGFIGLFGYTGYCASKYAVIGFSEALGRELEPYGVKVAVLCPPNTRTPGLAEENKYKPAAVLKAEEKVATVEPAYVAQQLLKAIPRGKFWIVPSMDGRLAHVLSRWAPSLFHQFVKRPPIEVA